MATLSIQPYASNQFSSDDKSLKGSDFPDSGDGIARFICIQLSVGPPYPVYPVCHTGKSPSIVSDLPEYTGIRAIKLQLGRLNLM